MRAGAEGNRVCEGASGSITHLLRDGDGAGWTRPDGPHILVCLRNQFIACEFRRQTRIYSRQDQVRRAAPGRHPNPAATSAPTRQRAPHIIGLEGPALNGGVEAAGAGRGRVGGWVGGWVGGVSGGGGVPWMRLARPAVEPIAV